MQEVYLDNCTLREAQAKFMEKSRLLESTEIIKTEDALGRVLAASVIAKRSMPSFHAAAMDGIAVKFQKTLGADEQRPIILNIYEDFLALDTGDPIPDSFDAVIMIEDIHWINKSQLEIIAPAAPWQHIRPVGEDVVAGEMLLPIYHKLTPPDLGVLLAGGILEVEVLKPPNIGVIPTGSELIRPEEEVTPGRIVDFNSTSIKAYLTQWGAEVTKFPIIKDNVKLLKEGILNALKVCDVLIINAGSSAGREDYTSEIISELGEVYVHGISVKPGKPVILGKINEKTVIGVPGYPVSAYLALEWFIKPLLHRYYGLAVPAREKISAFLGRRIVSSMGKEEFVRMTIGNVKEKYIANPLNRGAGVTMSLVKADGILRVPAESLGYEQGERVAIELYKPEEQLKNTIVLTGSHDLTLDILASEIRKAPGHRFLISSHVGSMGGLLAVQKGEAHAAGTHLLDPETGEYNISYIKKYLLNKEIVLINLVYREQGIILPQGNPDKVKNLKDIAEKGLSFINRQRGAGTRILFDLLLKKNNINPSQINGYKREEFTHLGVAAAVLSCSARAGIAIKSAALAYELDFIPIGEERYDLLMEKSFFESEAGKMLYQIMVSSVFKNKVEALGGYSTRETGKIIWETK